MLPARMDVPLDAPHGVLEDASVLNVAVYTVVLPLLGAKEQPRGSEGSDTVTFFPTVALPGTGSEVPPFHSGEGPTIALHAPAAR
tara:strand:- start:502 stop:756 length:255 start_codon:yes stop_codon:yes gene_type:complete